MEFVEIARCESAEPWWETKVQSSTDPEKSYVVLVPSSEATQDELICECLGFIHQGHCKHQAEVFDNLCRWDELTGPEWQDEINVCPRCGDPTVIDLELA